MEQLRLTATLALSRITSTNEAWHSNTNLILVKPNRLEASRLTVSRLIEYHLSPERGLYPTQVPEPSGTLLLGIAATLGILRRKRKVTIF